MCHCAIKERDKELKVLLWPLKFPDLISSGIFVMYWKQIVACDWHIDALCPRMLGINVDFYVTANSCIA